MSSATGRAPGFDPGSAGSSPASPAKFNRNVYSLARYHHKRRQFISLLGGRCVKCDTTKRLEFDHVSPRTKAFDIANYWDYPISVVLP